MHCGHCLDDDPCDMKTGICQNGCLPGFKGDLCKDCENQLYWTFNVFNALIAYNLSEERTHSLRLVQVVFFLNKMKSCILFHALFLFYVWIL